MRNCEDSTQSSMQGASWHAHGEKQQVLFLRVVCIKVLAMEGTSSHCDSCLSV